MSEATLEEVVRATVSTHLDIDPARLQAAAKLGDDLCIDSLAAAELIMVVEDATGVPLPDDAIRGVTTYGDFVDVVVHADSSARN